MSCTAQPQNIAAEMLDAWCFESANDCDDISGYTRLNSAYTTRSAHIHDCQQSYLPHAKNASARGRRESEHTVHSGHSEHTSTWSSLRCSRWTDPEYRVVAARRCIPSTANMRPPGFHSASSHSPSNCERFVWNPKDLCVRSQPTGPAQGHL